MADDKLIKSPFYDLGKIVYKDDRFVGRSKELQELNDLLLGGGTPRNVAVMGLPRIGKSSLVWKAVMTRREEMYEQSICPVFFQVGSLRNAAEFFVRLVEKCDQAVTDAKDDGALPDLCEEQLLKIQEKLVEPLSAEKPLSEVISLAQKFFRQLARRNCQLIVVFDEFDKVQSYFTGADFQVLRELSYNPDIHLCLITVTRKSLSELDSTEGAVSTFYGIFSEIKLGLFSKEDMKDYWARLNLSDSKKYQQQVQYFVGSHPYLLDMVNDICWRNGGLNVEVLANNKKSLRLLLMEQFKTIENQLQGENLLKPAIELVLGPINAATQYDCERLLTYQFLRKMPNDEKYRLLGEYLGLQIDSNTSFACFSDFFTIYFRELHDTDETVWPIWTQTEQRLRAAVKKFLKDRYKDEDWEVGMLHDFSKKYDLDRVKADHAFPPMSATFESIRQRAENTKKMFPEFSSDLIDHTYPKEIFFVFITPAWDVYFHPIFKGTEAEWRRRFGWLCRVRNPIAHSGETYLSSEDKAKVEDYCKEICDRLSSR